jgi:hypothetical protein
MSALNLSRNVPSNRVLAMLLDVATSEVVGVGARLRWERTKLYPRLAVQMIQMARVGRAGHHAAEFADTFDIETAMQSTGCWR